jgi:hypothetical protein
MSNERFHNENEKKRIAWHGGRYIPGFNSMQGKILYRNQPRRIDIIGKYGNVAHEKLRRTGGCERQRIFLSIDSRIFLSIDSRIFLLMDSRIFLSIDSRILCLEPLENELSLLVKGEAVRLENVWGEEGLQVLDANLAGSVTVKKKEHRVRFKYI